MIVLMAGLPGTGKSTLARALASGSGGVILNKDAIRPALFPPNFVEYSAEQDDFCQELMLQTAGYLLRKHPALTVFFDGRTYSQRYQRERVTAFARETGAAVAIIECVCSEATALTRIADDLLRGNHPAKNRTRGLYYHVRHTWQPIEEARLTVDTDAPLERAAEMAAAYLRSMGKPGGA